MNTMKPTHTKASRDVSPASRSQRGPRASRRQELKGNKAKPLSILVPIDIFDPSRAALEFAADFARRYGGRVLVLSVIQPDPFVRSERNPLVASQKTLRDRVVFKVSDLAKRHVGEDLLEKILVQSGKPFEKIIETARALKADFIVMATHGYTGLKHMLLGSTAERVIRFAPCPVMTVRDQGGREP